MRPHREKHLADRDLAVTGVVVVSASGFSLRASVFAAVVGTTGVLGDNCNIFR